MFSKYASSNFHTEIAESRVGFNADSIDFVKPYSIEVKLLVTPHFMDDISLGIGGITETLNPLRSPGVLPSSIFELLQSQMKLIAGLAHKHLIEDTASATAKSFSSMTPHLTGYGELLWGEAEAGEILTRGRTRAFTHNPTLARAASSDSANVDDSGSDGEAPPEASLRSRSVSIGPTRRTKKGQIKRPQIIPSSADSGKMSVLTKSTEVVIANDGTVDVEKTRNIRVLKGLPPNLSKNTKAKDGAVQGLWMMPCPLQIYPTSFWGPYVSINDYTHISESKQIGWKMDMIREYDEKRIERLECYSLSKRDVATDAASTKLIVSRRASAVPSSSATSGKYYYKDKGRQAYKVATNPC